MQVMRRCNRPFFTDTDVIMIAFFPEKYTVNDHISNTKLEKGDHYYIQTRHKDLFFFH